MATITKAFTGVNLSVQIGIPGANSPTAVYSTSAPPNADGLRLIDSITNEPTSLVYLPTTKNSDLHVQKTSERIKMHGNEAGPINLNNEAGEIFETFEGIMGNVTLILAKNSAGVYYSPGIDKMLRSATESNKLLYVKMQRYIGLDTALTPNKHVFHTKAALCLISMDGAPVDAQAKAVEQAFKLEGFGEWIEGYSLVA
jgi:hypothetical protein